jgi:hypothetical protein
MACREALGAADGAGEAVAGVTAVGAAVEITIATTDAITTRVDTSAYGQSPRS